MNPHQMALQLRHVLRSVAWLEGDADPVFGARAVHVVAGPLDPKNAPPKFPLALITIGSGTPDASAPDYILQTFEIATAVEVAGDPLGSHAIAGGARANPGRSAGAGVAEVAERTRAALQTLTGADGAAIVVSGAETGSPAYVGTRHVAFDLFRVSALCTSRPVYPAPEEFRVVGRAASWRGLHCLRRFDFLQFRVGYVSGSTPAETPDDFDAVVYTGTNLEAAVTTAPGRTYSVVADYDPRGTGSPVYSSSPSVGSYFST